MPRVFRVGVGVHLTYETRSYELSYRFTSRSFRLLVVQLSVSQATDMLQAEVSFQTKIEGTSINRTQFYIA